MVNVFDQVAAPAADRAWGYAGFWWRVLAWLVDSVILAFADLAVHAAFGDADFGVLHFHRQSSGGITNISDITAPYHYSWQTTSHWGWLGLLLPVAYFSLLESSRWQATVGKRVCHLRVTGLEGHRIGLGRAIGRYLGKFLSALIFGFGFLMIGWTRRKQGLHDLLAETLVLRRLPLDEPIRFKPPA